MMSLIEKLKNTRIFNSIDLHFANFMGAQSQSESTVLASALLSLAVQQGHICLHLDDLDQSIVTSLNKEDISIPGSDTWAEQLRSNGKIVGNRASFRAGNMTPLILDEKSLFLERYYNYEENLVDKIQALSQPLTLEPGTRHLVSHALNDSRIFEKIEHEVNWQQVAAFQVIMNRFSVISGGPGTGKTTTLAKILCILYEMYPELSIALAAPTGKAAARMGEAVKCIKKQLIREIPERKDAILRIPDASGSTIHRLLGTRMYSDKFKFNEENRLRYDMVIVDECSMISLPLMAKLLEALKDNARLVLLGDKDQLASVEAGRCFGEICESSRVNTFPSYFASDFMEITGVNIPRHNDSGRSIVQLLKSYRFPDESMVGKVSREINRGDPSSAIITLKATKSIPSSPEDSEIKISWHEAPTKAVLHKDLAPLVILHFKAISTSDSHLDALNALNKVRILTCVKHGDFGVCKLNEKVEEILSKSGLIRKDEIFYENRPIMILKNDYSLKLFNGDIGIIRSDENGIRRAWFPTTDDDTMRSFAPSLLPQHETVYAMTIHKSQGSEFDTVIMVLPIRETPVLTRELLYTGITRTRGRIELFATEKIFKQAIASKVTRKSGLLRKL
jgi:exodeoxyribonuclease V alpha subunit